MTSYHHIPKTKVFNGIKYTLYAIKYLDKDECKEEAKWIREQGIKARIVYEMPKWCIYFVKEEIDMLASWFEIPDNPIGAAIMRGLPPQKQLPPRRIRQARPASETTLSDFVGKEPL